MKKILLTVAFLGAAFGFERPLQARFIGGGEVYKVTPIAGDPLIDLTFTLKFDTWPPGGSDDFNGVHPFSFINTFDVTSDATLLAPVPTFGDPATYGAFQADRVLENSLSPGVSRTFAFHGTFTPTIPPFAAGLTANSSSSLTITINRTGTAVSAVATLSSSVPEPAGIVLLGTCCVPVAWGWRMRHRRLAQAS